MASLKFILRKDKGNNRGESPIYAQYKHGDSKTLIATGKRIDPKYWEPIQGKVKNHVSALALNSFFASISNTITRLIIEIQQADLEPTPKRLRDAYLKHLNRNTTNAILNKSLVYLWTEYVNNRKNSLAPRTTQNQLNSIQSLDRYLKEAKLGYITPENFTMVNLIKWENFLSKDSKPNTVAKRLKHFKLFLKYFEEVGGKSGVPLNKIKYKETAGLKTYLTEQELMSFANANLQGRLEAIRDIFVLQCYTGLRISDLKRLDKSINNNRIELTTQKTGVRIEIPINNLIKGILEKYDYKLPSIPDQKINQGIKEIYCTLFPQQTVQVRIHGKYETKPKSEMLSSHAGIRTFITLSAEKGMNITSIAKITGKSIQVLLKNYLSESQKTAERDFNKAWDNL